MKTYKNSLHSIFGGMTTDYFEIFCDKCEVIIKDIKWHSSDPAIGCKLQAKCPKCGEVYVFKFRLSGVTPIEK